MTIDDVRDCGMIVFECISGSKAYGLDTPESDTDKKGIFVLPLELFYSLTYHPQVNNDSNDIVYYELSRFVELLARNNPNLLEMLFVEDECVLCKHPLIERIRPEMFISKLCKTTFAGYAMDQIKRARGLKKKILNPVDRVKRRITDFCYVIDGYKSIPVAEWLKIKGYDQRLCGLVVIMHTKDTYGLFYDSGNRYGFSGIAKNDDSMDVALSSIPKNIRPDVIMFFNRDAYSRYCKDYHEYWEWVTHRNDARYRSTLSHGRKYDAKNMMHTFRLLDIAEEIAKTGRFNTKRPNRNELLEIKSGAFSYEELMDEAKRKLILIESLFERPGLPDEPDLEAINSLLVFLRKEFYKDSVLR
jgi:hypothetical protein